MLAIIQAAGWPIWPLLIASIIAVGIVLERFITLRQKEILPPNLLQSVIQEYRQGGARPELLQRLQQGSLLGQLFATGLRQVGQPRDVMKESLEEAGRAIAHELERFLTTLGTIATIAPLLGLLGTVFGMIEIFGAQNTAAGSSPEVLAHGISVALYNTAAGLVVAIPSMIFYRHFRGKVDALLLDMEQQAIKLVEILQGQRQG